MIKVEMLSTGDEVLYGQIVDTNAAWLADYLFEQGLPMSGRSTVGDNLEALVCALQRRSRECDVLIVNGGLGPTSDDLSAEAAARAAGVALVEDADWLETMARYFSSRGREMSPANRKQALIPQGSEVIDNPVGTACGFAMRLNGCLLCFTPGVPSEFKTMVKQQILPLLRRCFELPAPPLCLRLTTFGRGESELAQALDTLPRPQGVTLGYRSAMPIIELKLTGPDAMRTQMMTLWQEVRRVAGDSLIFEGTDGLAARLARLLAARELRLAVSEQFTGGLLCWQLGEGGVTLQAGEVLAPPSQPETLAQSAARAARFAEQTQSDLALVVGARQEEHLNLVLHTPEGSQGLKISLNGRRYSQRDLQQVCAMMAQNMLRRWLEGLPLEASHSWIQVESRFPA
ncbi:nicotinamide mononucleotide deamidase-related protein YfaY [Jejubacter calystegiae]|uniref:CinA-like protein n=1 Tax=Jejubacter calystegiae TaxID=2579935 RepID=A0A4P8YMT9_9ENTR|nr:nicotinamide mononucleotide deamidase-related protein YfaY [Jejubacter calystegiae]QCT22160.1 nicotinamide mononucleotide deamidase-related protein YfaY [Jejubacter calystegiae]